MARVIIHSSTGFTNCAFKKCFVFSHLIDFFFQLFDFQAQDTYVCNHILFIELSLIFNHLCSLGKFKCWKSFLERNRGICDCRYNARLWIASQTILKNKGEFGVSIRNVSCLSLALFNQRINDAPQHCQALVNVGCFLESLASCTCKVLSLRTCKINEMEFRALDLFDFSTLLSILSLYCEGEEWVTTGRFKVHLGWWYMAISCASV